MDHNQLPARPPDESGYDLSETERRQMSDAAEAFALGGEQFEAGPLGPMHLREVPAEVIAAHNLPYSRVQVVRWGAHKAHSGPVPTTINVVGMRDVAHSLPVNDEEGYHAGSVSLFGVEQKMITLSKEEETAIPGVDAGVSVELNGWLQFTLPDGRKAIGQPPEFTASEASAMMFVIQDALMAQDAGGAPGPQT